LRDFCAFHKLKITNSFCRHKDIHKFTWEARGTRSIIDYIIVNGRLKSNIEYTRAFRGSEIDSDHKLMESKYKFNYLHMQNIATQKRTKQHTKKTSSIYSTFVGTRINKNCIQEQTEMKT
jgi:hypothetical protein